ncbi:MAG: hypothetical protein PHC92_04025 [Syntrophomonadaceae bacterium]|nr:hypothetical protein [Syntrophomonadaceae bacterium]
MIINMSPASLQRGVEFAQQFLLILKMYNYGHAVELSLNLDIIGRKILINLPCVLCLRSYGRVNLARCGVRPA